MSEDSFKEAARIFWDKVSTCHSQGCEQCETRRYNLARAMEMVAEQSWEEAGHHGYPPYNAISDRVVEKLKSGGSNG